MADTKNIGFFKLTGLCIGPILGSGIVFLPSLAIELAGKASLATWIILFCIGFPFAYYGFLHELFLVKWADTFFMALAALLLWHFRRRLLCTFSDISATEVEEDR